jgi:hypothetical protein
MKTDEAPAWLLLVVSLPTSSSTARMRVWRGLKALGCVPLRDGAYLLPAGAQREQALRELGDECTREGGVSWLMAVQPRSAQEQQAYRQLFDRADEYAELRRNWKELHPTLSRLSASELTRTRRRLQREFDAVQSIEFFPGDHSAEALAAWTELNGRIAQLLSPDEPHEIAAGIPRLDRREYRGRTWATRRRMWVDRVASAWLIRRFIDPDAKFRWLERPSDCPKSALGFDFDGAAFTHVGDRVTFETLLASFGLEDDAGLLLLGALVHQLDVGGEPLPEAAGFEAVMTGARERLDDDDALLAEMSSVLDSLHAHFTRAAVRSKT